MEQTIEKDALLSRFGGYDTVIDELGDALQNIALAGNFGEDGKWQEPEWKLATLQAVAMARQELQELHALYDADSGRLLKMKREEHVNAEF